MADFMADTNVGLRRYLPKDPLFKQVKETLQTLVARGDRVFLTPQVLIETRALATRPREANGLGFTASEASQLLEMMEADFPLLPETPDVYPLWKDLTARYGIIGRQVFDARLVAVMLSQGVSRLLTLNPTHFRRFAEITVHALEEIED